MQNLAASVSIFASPLLAISIFPFTSGKKHDDIYITRSLGALRAPTSSWGPFGPLDFVLYALRALRPCDPRSFSQEGRHLFTITYSPKFSYSSLAGWRERMMMSGQWQIHVTQMTAICKYKIINILICLKKSFLGWVFSLQIWIPISAHTTLSSLTQRSLMITMIISFIFTVMIMIILITIIIIITIPIMCQYFVVQWNCWMSLSLSPSCCLFCILQTALLSWIWW